jgi:chemotaxis protein histidine kinase CheA
MRYRSLAALIVCLTVVTAPARAQQSTSEQPPTDQLRERVRERLGERVREELKLSPDQMTRLRNTVGDYAGRRRDMQARQRELRQALADQLRPGIAAIPDSVGRLTDDLMTLRVHYAETFRAEQREMSKYLDPVQRAKLMLLRDRLLNRAQEFRRRRAFPER